METWYRAQDGKVEAVDVVRSTSKTVTLAGSLRNERIDTDYRWYRKNREQAKLAMVAEAVDHRDRAQRILENAEARLTRAQNA